MGYIADSRLNICTKPKKCIFKHYFVPGNNISVDEQLVKFRVNSLFRQYMPQKLVKYVKDHRDDGKVQVIIFTQISRKIALGFDRNPY